MKKILFCAILWCTLSLQGQSYSYYINHDTCEIITMKATPTEDMGVKLETLKVYHIPPEVTYYTKQLDVCKMRFLIDKGYYCLPDSSIKYGKVVPRTLYIKNNIVRYRALLPVYTTKAKKIYITGIIVIVFIAIIVWGRIRMKQIEYLINKNKYHEK